VKFIKLIFLLLLLQGDIFGGGWDLSPQDESFSIFHDYFEKNQESPFLPQKSNLRLWKELLPHWNENEILNRNNNAKNSSFWISHAKPIDQKVKAYLDLQNQSAKSNRLSFDAWDYDSIINKADLRNLDNLLIKVKKQFHKESNRQLKQRYGYLCTRLLFLNQNYQKGVLFYQNELKSFEKNEIYYQSIDYAAGCFYSLKQFEKAAEIYYEVLVNSGDKKESARESLRYCFSKQPSLLKKFAETKENFQFYLLQGKVKFSDHIYFLEKALELNIDTEKLRPIVVKAIIQQEIHFLPINKNPEEQPRLTKKKQLERILTVINKVLRKDALKDRDFWVIAQSYCFFMKGDSQQALMVVNQIKPDQLRPLHKQLQAVYQVSLWDNVDDTKERFLSTLLTQKDFDQLRIGFFNQRTGNYYRFRSSKWKYYILDQVSHLYYKDGQFVKSILTFHTINRLNRCSSQMLLNQAFDLTNKKLNPFEKMLLHSHVNSKELLLLFQSFLYMRRFDIQNAFEWAQKLDNKSKALDIKFPLIIFSNSILYDDLNKPELIKKNYGFLNQLVTLLSLKVNEEDILKSTKIFNHKQLFEFVYELKKLTKSTDRDTRFIANYALGNFFINTTNQGLYRNCYLPHRYRREYGNSGESVNDFEKRLQQRQEFNMRNVDLNTNSYFGHCKFAKRFYRQALRNTNDKETEAKCLYFIAQCELYQFECEHQNDPFNHYEADEPLKVLRQTFSRLENDYSDCQFTKEVIKECGRFRYYQQF